MIEAIILAAGRSERMGEKNKLLLPYEQTTLLNRVIEQVKRSKIHNITVVLGHEAELVRESIIDTSVKIVENKHFANGLTSSIIAGLEQLNTKTDAILLTLGDLPMITHKDYNKLIEHFKQLPKPAIMRPVYKNYVGHPIFFDRVFFDDLRANQEKDGCKLVIQKHQKHFHAIEVTELLYFFDIDTPADYKRLLKTLDLSKRNKRQDTGQET